MFNFSLRDFFLYQLILNDDLSSLIEKKKIEDSIEAKKAIINIIKKIISDYISGSGLLPYLKKLKVEEKEIQREERYISEQLLSTESDHPQSPTFRTRLTLFKKKQRDSMATSFFYELEDCFSKLAENILTTPSDKLLMFLAHGDNYSHLHSALMQIYLHMQKKVRTSAKTSLSFYEYLEENQRTTDPGRPDIFNYLNSLEKFLTSLPLPKVGDTHLKTTATELLNEIEKIRQKLRDDEQKVLQAESEKIQAMQFVILKHVHHFTLEDFKENAREWVNDNIKKIEEGTAIKTWEYLNSKGCFDHYTDLLKMLDNKLIYLNKILEKRNVFDHIISEINALKNKTHSTTDHDFIYRIISIEEFNTIKTNLSFTQDKRYSTAENAKWFFFNNGRPSVENDYICKVFCLKGTLDLIQRLINTTEIDTTTTLLIKENEPDCIGIHEEILAHFNLLILRIEAVDKTGKRFIVNFDSNMQPIDYLMPKTEGHDSLTYFQPS